ncbi:MAG TPA: hypothetical protein VH374_07840 [Polyangia bacterium]|nr:hypothetical protein [Polyangia bacterium]
MKTVAGLLKRARPVEIPGHGTLRPGTIWMGNKMLVYAETMRVCASVDDRLFEYGIGDWFREAEIQGLQKAAKSAKGWCTLAEIEMAVVCELIAPWYLLLGINCAKVGLFYHENKKEIDDAFQVAPKAMKLLLYAKRRYPLLCKKLAVGATKDVIIGLKDQVVTNEHIASFIADLIKDMTEDPEMAIGRLAKVMVKVSFTVLVKKSLAGMGGTAVVTAASRKCDELISYMNRVGYPVTLSEANAITHEVAADPMAPLKLQELEMTIKALLPLLKKLQEEKESEGG